MKYQSLLKTWNLKNKRVLLRIDANVPLKNGNIIDDYKLQSIRPTLDFLLEQQCFIIIATHIGRPKAKDPRYSTQHLIPWFTQHNYPITFSPTMEIQPDKPITLLENLRFYSGEKKDDTIFAKKLANLADYYVNDAFGLLHRTDTSITTVPLMFSKDKRTIGFLIEKELDALYKLKNKPSQPFVLIVGGGKVHDKLPLLNAFLDQVQSILICPAISFTFSKLRSENIGRSLIDNASKKEALLFLKKAEKLEKKIVLPVDYQIAKESIHGPLSYTDTIDNDSIGISIGPKTITLFKKEIDKAKTIFFNGMPGISDRPETLVSGKELLKLIGSSSAYTVIGGGDTVATARTQNLEGLFDYCSTGGGAALAYLSNNSLPGLKPF